MTKAAEIAVIDDAIKKLGHHSYLGPWLTEIRAELVADLTSDFTPDPMMPSKARAWALGFMEETKKEAAKVREAADAYAKGSAEKAHTYAADVRREAKLLLTRLAEKL